MQFPKEQGKLKWKKKTEARKQRGEDALDNLHFQYFGFVSCVNNTVMSSKKQSKKSTASRQIETDMKERKNLKILHSPLKTSLFFFRECLYQLSCLASNLSRHKISGLLITLIILGLFVLRNIDGSHKVSLMFAEKKLLWWSWWVLLGFLSSCGFGSGLHTFVLYLGPFIAQVTMSAYICKSLNFPEPPYPEKIVCPEQGSPNEVVTFFNIVRKVQGFGTAMGELPPYFMARGARLASNVQTEEFELTGKPSSSSSETEADPLANGNTQASTSATKPLSRYQRLEMLLQKIVLRAGFFGIVLCASVPNPLFDLAGMTCGHFLVPFSTFFGATCVGKALIKVHIQQFAVIAVSSENHIDTLVHYIGRIPVIGDKLQQPFMEYLQLQREKLHNKVVDTVSLLLLHKLICQ
ncbi:unnamed protein product [Dibothriocephalus latus]|uniref:Vacuole membrane protein 1 n=1 Tax=Dibothriocephalus latus TaxID=60516 RepID=A0A3P7L517_DIBLA|nr:unnamed protein product [Dibothriocephalus latus]